jgi:hypothetical protein
MFILPGEVGRVRKAGTNAHGGDARATATSRFRLEASFLLHVNELMFLFF